MRAQILFVEATPDIARSVTALLEQQAYAVTRAQDERDAVERLAREHFDVLIVDVKVTAERAGLTFLQHLNAAAQHLLPRTIVISADPSAEVERELAAIGVCGIVLKPIHDADILAAVEECLDSMSATIH
jgi:DNA-binding response OmpR family regulator